MRAHPDAWYILVGTTPHRLAAARGPVLGRALLTSAGAGTPSAAYVRRRRHSLTQLREVGGRCKGNRAGWMKV